MFDRDALDAMVNHVAANQAERDRQAAQYDAMNQVLFETFEQRDIDPFLLKLVHVLAIVRAADQMTANAVRELTQMVDERRGETG